MNVYDNILEMEKREISKIFVARIGRFPCYRTHLRSMATYHLESKYLHMMGYLYITGLFWWTIVYYDPRKIESFQLHIQHELNRAAR